MHDLRRAAPCRNRAGRRHTHPQVPAVKALGIPAAVWYNPATMSTDSRTSFVFRGYAYAYAYAWRFS